MAAIKKASFASKQNRAGPAPLASFEDLPSDELESPNSSRDDPDSISSSPIPMQDGDTPGTFVNAIFSEGESTPGTVMCSPLSVLQIDVTQDNDNESQHTLTPCDILEGDSPIRKDSDTNSLASTLKKLEVGQYNEPALLPSPESLNVVQDASQTADGTQRKGSWTDIFRSRSRSRSHSPQPSPQSPRKAPLDLPIKEIKDGNDGKKHKKGILSIFKFHDKKSQKGGKSPVNLESPSGGTFPGGSLTQNVQSVDPIINGKEPKSSSSKEHSNKDIPSNVPESETDANMETVDSNSATKDLEIIDTDDSPKHKELRAKLSLERKSKSLDHEPLSGRKDEDFRGSSESELANECPVEVKVEEEEEIDFEAETLLTQDSVEYEETFDSTTLEVFQIPTKTLPRRQRLDITTVPIERPRSTTPISVAPFEAFIQSAQQVPLPESNVEKIKVLLPGEQFTARLKSPKKGSQRSWQDFCHSGLHSPRTTKRTPKEAFDGSDLSPPTPNFSDSPFGNSDWAADAPFGDSKWETFDTSKNSENPTSDQLPSLESSLSKDSFTLTFNCLPSDRKTVCSNNDMILANVKINPKTEQSDNWSSSSSSNSSQ